MGILDAPAIDSRGRALVVFDPARDLPGLTLRGHWLADDLTGANGSAVAHWRDRSGRGADLIQPTAATRPTLVTSAVNGRKAVRFNGSQLLLRNNLFGSYTAPSTVVVVASAAPTIGTQRVIVGGVGTTTHNLYIDSPSGGLAGFAGGAARGGPRIDDNGYHVLISQARADGSGRTFVDGYPTGTVGSGNTAANSTLGVGGKSDGAQHIGDICAVMWFSGEVTTDQLKLITDQLADYYGLTAGPTDSALNNVDTTSPNGQPVRYWMPSAYDPAVATPLVIWSHPHQHTYQINPVGYWASPLIQSLVNAGYLVVSSNQHSVPAGTGATSEMWGAQAALDDTLDAYTLMASRFNVGKVILAGASMGGLASSLMVPDGRIPNVKGVAVIDGVFNLANNFAGNTGSFASFIRGAYGIAADGSDYAAKTTGHDPVLRSASDYTGIGWRFYASTADTTVAKAQNTDTMAALVAAAPEAVVVSQFAGHLDASHAVGADMVAFIKRCLAR